MKSRTDKLQKSGAHASAAILRARASAFTLIELLVAIALMAAIIPIVVQGLRVASLAGEVSERKALATRVGERVLNDTIVNSQTLTANNGTETLGPYQFHWTVKNEPWNALTGLSALNNPNSVNQSVVNSTLIHQLSVDVTYVAQGRNFAVHLSTLINTSTP